MTVDVIVHALVGLGILCIFVGIALRPERW